MTGPNAARAAMAVPVAGVAGNALAYLVLLVAARTLDHDGYGSLAVLLGVLLVGSVASLALQTVTARRVAAGEGTDGIATATTGIAVAAAVVLCLATPALAGFLHLDASVDLLLVAAALVPTTWFGPLLGMAQGDQRFARLAVLAVAQALGRSGGGLAGLWLIGSDTAAVTGIAIGTSLAALAARATTRWPHGSGAPRTRDVLVETLHASHGYGTFLVLAGLDLLLARHVLGSGPAAVYAAGTVVQRGALWLPQSVALLAFARMTVHASHHRTVRQALAVIIGLGAVLVLAVAVGGDLVVTVVGGEYRQLASIAWLFALIGANLAVVQFSVVAGLALLRRRRIALLWLTGAAEAFAILGFGGHATPFRIAVLVAVLTGAAAVVSAVLATRAPNRPGPAEYGEPSAARAARR